MILQALRFEDLTTERSKKPPKKQDKRIKKNEKWKMKKDERMKNEEEIQPQESSHQQPVTGMPKNEPTDEEQDWN